VVVVETPSTEKDEKKKDEKPKRGRPSGTTKNKSSSTKKSAPAIDGTQVKMLLLTVSGIIASRPNMEVFALSMDEVEQIAQPLTNIMSKNDGLRTVAGEYADHLALLIACATIMIPKLLIYQANNPKKKEVKKNEQPIKQREQLKQPEARKSTSDTRRNVEPAPTNGQEFGNALYDHLPSIV
jgi:hypothetical protein